MKRISSAAVILYQIISDVGKNSLACNLSEVQRYTTQIGAGLSTDALLHWAKELESHGYVLVLQNKTDSWIMTDIEQFINKVQEQLFSEKSKH